MLSLLLWQIPQHSTFANPLTFQVKYMYRGMAIHINLDYSQRRSEMQFPEFPDFAGILAFYKTLYTYRVVQMNKVSDLRISCMRYKNKSFHFWVIA